MMVLRLKSVLLCSFAICISFIISACALANSADIAVAMMDAEYPVFDSLSSAIADSNAIIEARFISSNSEMEYPDISTEGDSDSNPQAGMTVSPQDMEYLGVPMTTSKIRVTSVLMGSIVVGETLEISQLGGTINRITYLEMQTVLIGNVALSKDDSLLLFAQIHEDGSASLISPAGLLVLNGDQIHPARDNRESDPALSQLPVLDRPAWTSTSLEIVRDAIANR